MPYDPAAESYLALQDTIDDIRSEAQAECVVLSKGDLAAIADCKAMQRALIRKHPDSFPQFTR